MGRKIHPVGFRLKVNRDWDARWYAEGKDFKDKLHMDFAIRRLIKKLGRKAGVSRIEIERSNQLMVNIHTAKPGILIGRKGDAVKDLRVAVENLAGQKVKVEVTEIEKPDLDAQLVAENIVDQLERRIGHSRAMKRAISQAMRQGAQGIKIEVTGRLAGSDMSRREWASEGRVPRSSLRASIDYGFAEALTTFGRLGCKVWIYKGEVLTFQQEEKAKGKKDVYVTP
ncbi:MAG TPA: 30S ribosomal protein S3 [Aggregatilineales bacterium]|nr:30S ribosomal protein S3 [Aggregatilineales bacterium]